MKKKEQSLYERLLAYGKSDYAAFHMPGHKRQVRPASLPEGLPWEIDITEIDGFDDLHHAEGILKESMNAAASFYGVKKTLYSINGSTAGILSAVFAAAKPGETILMGRNCHKSVYYAVMLRGLRPLYLYPQIEEETGLDCGYIAMEVEKKLTEHPEIRAVILTSPTYEGVVADIRTMAAMTRRRGIPLLVDEAHGAHLSVRGQIETEQKSKPAFPFSAVNLGADLVIQSIHKTLPSLTQTALLHICEGASDSLAEEAVRYMSIFQTSSPSYILLASIDACLQFMASREGQKQRRDYAHRLGEWRNKWKRFSYIRLLEPGKGNSQQSTWQDASKLILSAAGCTGRRLYDWLRNEYHLQPEMCALNYVLLMTSLFDTEEMYQRLDQALCEIEERLSASEGRKYTKNDTAAGGRSDVVEFQEDGRHIIRPHPAVCVLSPAEADGRLWQEISLWESAGSVSAQYVYLYPPGIPLLVPGEKIQAQTLAYLKMAKETGIEIKGLQDQSEKRIRVVNFTSGK